MNAQTAFVYGMAKAIANAAANATGAPQAGVVVTVVPDGRDTFYSVWGIRRDGSLAEVRLDANSTNLPRLTAHVEGFIANHKAHWA